MSDSSYFTRLSKNTFVYGSGQIVTKMLTFFMLPWSTRYLTPEDYGVMGILAVLALSVFGLFTLGFGASLPRRYGDASNEGERAAVIWSGFAALLINTCLWIAVALFFIDPLSIAILGDLEYKELVIVTLVHAAFANLQLPFLTFFKIRERAFLIVMLTMIEVAVTLGLIIYWVFNKGMGCYGMMYAGAVGQATTFTLLLAAAALSLPLRFSFPAVREMVSIGYPYIVGVLGTFLMQSSARYILQLLTDRAEVAMFFMSSNFGKLVELVVSGFMSAWIPFSIEFIHKREEARALFGRFISYYSMAMSLFVLLFFIAAKPVVRVMVDPVYYRVWPLVGIMAATYSLWGIYTMMSCCFTFNKRSTLQVFAEIAAGVSCIGFSFLLIPFMGCGGAAAATLLSFIALITITYFFSKRLLPIDYEGRRLLFVGGGFSVAAALTYLPIESMLVYSPVMTAVYGGYALFLYRFCLTDTERVALEKKLNLRVEQLKEAP